MKFRICLLFVLICFCNILNSTTWHIKLDGTGDFTTIQEGIDASTDADTVLVYPGIFYENLNMNSKNITLASLELTTGNEQYITNTVVDGQREGSCIEMQDIAIGATIRGLTIQNGFGNDLSVNVGGGVLAQCVENTYIINCCINDNFDCFSNEKVLDFFITYSKRISDFL